METNVALDYNVVSEAFGQHLLLMARINANPTPESGRPPLNISIVLDRSGSMQGEKLEHVKNAAQLIPQYLSADDRFSLVTYHNYVEVPLPPQPPIRKDYIQHTIRMITAGGDTNLSGGWLQGCELVAQEMQNGQVKRMAGQPASEPGEEHTIAPAQINQVFLLTDGIANRGVTDPQRLAVMAKQKREEGIVTTTIGVGMDFNEDLLVSMASEGGGTFHFIDSPEQAAHIFTGMLGYVLGLAAQNLTITVTLLQGARLEKQVSAYSEQQDGGVITYRLGDMTRDEQKSLLLELSIPPLEGMGEVEIARLRFDFDELGEQEVTHRTLEQLARVTVAPEVEAKRQPLNPEVAKVELLLRAVRARQEALRAADRKDFRDAMRLLAEAADAIEQASLDDNELQAEHDMLREEAMDMELGPQRYDAHMRKVATTTIIGFHNLPEWHSDSRDLRERMKKSRSAIERNGPTPRVMKWRRKSLELTANMLRFGRAEDNDICIPEDEVTRYHCQVVREGDHLFLYDLTSRNGTFANGGLVAGRFCLSAGDVVSIGTWLFRFKE